MKELLITSFCIGFAGMAYAQAPRLDQKVVLDNPEVKVTQYVSGPGGDVCGEGRHTHPAHLTVLLTDAKVQVMLPDGRKLNQNAPAGTTFWSEAETHTVTNMGKKPVKAYIVTYKNKPK